MANIWEEAILILAGNLNFGCSRYLITTVTVLTLVCVVFAIGHTVEAYARLCGYFWFHTICHLAPATQL